MLSTSLTRTWTLRTTHSLESISSPLNKVENLLDHHLALKDHPNQRFKNHLQQPWQLQQPWLKRNRKKDHPLHSMTPLAMKKMTKTTNQSTKMSLDPSGCDHPKQHAINLHTDLAVLETIPSLLRTFLKMIRKTRHTDSKAFTQTNSMEIAYKPQDSWLLSIGSCS